MGQCTEFDMIPWQLLILLFSADQLLGREFKFDQEQKCGWQSCNPTRPRHINVHLVPHSHDDAGWLKTVDQYYYGARQEIQRASVQYTIESVVKELVKDPTKKFIQVETGFMWRWWKNKDDFMRNMTLSLINSGQLQFAGGGWSMNDEAATHFVSIIDNLEFGVNWLKDNLGDCSVPDIAWQIDPFGHSKEQARIFTDMGYKGLFFARIDHQDKDVRKENQLLQMIWEGEEGDETKGIFTGVFDDHYSAPNGFCWDILCTDEPINDDPTLQEYNVESRISDFIAQVKSHAQYYKNKNHLMFTMGDDFHYQNARMYYKNMDKLIEHMNKRSEETGIHVLYSTPSCYLKSLYGDNLTYPRKTDDFFPYASDSDSFWTGYFTSRPSIKLQDRIGQRDLMVCKQLEVADSSLDTNIVFNMHRAMGLMQHHDAVTGTEKQHVASDYTKRLYKATEECNQQNVKTMSKKSGITSLNLNSKVQYEPETFCPNLNVSACAITESSDNFVTFIYNSLTHAISPYIRLPVTTPNISLYTLDGRKLSIQINQIPDHVQKVPSRNSTAQYEAIFRVFDIPPLGFTALFATKASEEVPVSFVKEVENQNKPETRLHAKNNVGVKLQYYKGIGSSSAEKKRRNSGAYVFNPDGSGKHNFTSEKTFTITGPLVNETFITYDDWGIVAVREYLEDVTEISWQVGPIPIDDQIGKEAVVVYSSNFKSAGTFYTDSNGRQMMTRKRLPFVNPAPNFETSNYYPVTSRIELRSEDGNILTVLPDRSEGGTSLVDGEIELMLHRRLLFDDGFGVGEALNETETFDGIKQGLVVVGKHLLLSGHSLGEARRRMFENTFQPQLSFLPTTMTLETWLQSSFRDYSGLAKELPVNVQVLTLSRGNNSTILLRLYNMMDQLENEEPVVVDLEGLFSEFSIVDFKEQNLSGAKDLETTNTEQLKWKTNTADSPPKERKHFKTDFIVELNPEQIRTFLLTVKWN